MSSVAGQVDEAGPDLGGPARPTKTQLEARLRGCPDDERKLERARDQHAIGHRMRWTRKEVRETQE